MKYLFIVQGEGRGHLTQAMTMEKMLSAHGHEVVGMLVGKSKTRMLPEFFLHGVKPYDGHDSYFKGLSIEETWQDDGQYHVLHLDFHGLNMQCTQSFELFEQKLNAALQEFADQLGLTVQTEFSDFSSHFEALLKQLADNSLILLVDEYDTPLVSRLQMPEELEAATALLQGLFGKVKKHSSKFRCVFFTGITRYQDLGMGTAGNNFTDISVEPSFASCCGYTREEIKRCFADYLRYSAAVRYGCSDEEVTEAQIEALPMRWRRGMTAMPLPESRNRAFTPLGLC